MVLAILYDAPDILIPESRQWSTFPKTPGQWFHEAHMSNFRNIQKYNKTNSKKYKVITKSLSTWWFYCNRQVHRDILISLFVYLFIYLFIYHTISNIFLPIRPSSGCLQEQEQIMRIFLTIRSQNLDWAGRTSDYSQTKWG